MPAVPDEPTGLTGIVTGTASVNLTWDALAGEDLMGGIALYLIFLGNGLIQTESTSISLVNSQFLISGVNQVIEVDKVHCLN